MPELEIFWNGVIDILKECKKRLKSVRKNVHLFEERLGLSQDVLQLSELREILF